MMSPVTSPRSLTGFPSQTRRSSHFARGILGILIGASLFVVGLIMDPILAVMLPFPWAEGQIDSNFAYTSIALVTIGLVTLFVCATHALTSRSADDTSENLTSLFSTFSRIFSNGSHSRVLLVSAIVYAAIYGLASGTIVIQPSVNFSTIYHITTPSTSVATCCGTIGEIPLVTVFATEQIGLVLSPLNLLLLFSISWLVGLNVALLTLALKLRNQRGTIRWVWGLGAFVGLFTACPTCAGLAVLSVVSGIGTIGGGLSTILLLGPIRIAFLVSSYLTLTIGSIVTSRMLTRAVDSGCVTRLE